MTDPANRADGSSGAILRWYAFGLGANDIVSQVNIALGTRTTPLPDIQGSIVASLDSGSGALTKTGYLAYGESPAGLPANFGYTGQQIDVETNGLYYFRARHYSPPLGRFMQVDPIGYQGGVHLYAYVGNDPLNLLDPNGLVIESIGNALSTFAQGSAFEQQATADFFNQHPYTFAAVAASPLTATGVGAAAESLLAGAGAAGVVGAGTTDVALVAVNSIFSMGLERSWS